MSTDLVIRDTDTGWSSEQLAVLRHMGVEGAPREELQVFHHQSKRTGLDPFSKQIYMLARKQKNNRTNQWETKWTIQTGIDGYRVTAHRAAKRDGVTLGYGPTEWCGAEGVWREVWTASEPPAAARVTVLRGGEPFPAVAHYDEYAQRDGQGNVNRMWRNMARNQLAKCAEALALRKAFPNDLGGVYTDAEMHQAAAEDRSEDELREDMRKRMGWLIKQVGLNAEDALRVVSQHAGRDVTDSKTLTADELLLINDALEVILADQVTSITAEVVDADVVEGEVDTETGEVEMITDKTQRRQRAQRADLDMKDDEPFWKWLEVQFGRPFTSSKEQSEAEALEACRRMQIMVDAARELEGEQS